MTLAIIFLMKKLWLVKGMNPNPPPSACTHHSDIGHYKPDVVYWRGHDLWLLTRILFEHSFIIKRL